MMEDERERYIEKLEAKNGYCSCSSLKKLYNIKKEAESLTKICNMFKAECDLENSSPEDKDFLEDYKKNRDKLEKIIEEYYQNIKKMAREKKIKFALRNIGDDAPFAKVSYKSALEILREKESDLIITIHCANCNQQIDVASQ